METIEQTQRILASLEKRVHEVELTLRMLRQKLVQGTTSAPTLDVTAGLECST